MAWMRCASSAAILRLILGVELLDFVFGASLNVFHFAIDAGHEALGFGGDLGFALRDHLLLALDVGHALGRGFLGLVGDLGFGRDLLVADRLQICLGNDDVADKGRMHGDVLFLARLASARR